MFCPQCRSEYRQGYTTCHDCQVGLVEALPPEPYEPDARLVRVFATGDPVLIPLVKSTLEEAGIEVMSRGDVQDAIGWGRRGSMPSGVVGPVEFYVAAERADEAREILARVTEPLPVDPEEPEQP